MNTTITQLCLIVNVSMITIVPGRATYLPVEFRDNLGHNVTLITVCYAKFDHKQSQHNVHLDPVSNVITNNQIIQHGQPGEIATVILTPLGNVYYVLEILLILILVLQAIVQPFRDITHNIAVLSYNLPFDANCSQICRWISNIIQNIKQLCHIDIRMEMTTNRG